MPTRADAASRRQLRYRTHVVEGIENAFPSLNLRFNGGNTGKLLVRIGEDH